MNNKYSLPRSATWQRDKQSYTTCIVHGVFQWSDGRESGPLAVIELPNGEVLSIEPSNLTFDVLTGKEG